MHQQTLINGWPITEIMRYIRTNSNEYGFISIKELFKQRLIARGYPSNIIDNIVSRHTYNDRNKLLAIERIEFPLQHDIVKPYNTSLLTAKESPIIFITRYCPSWINNKNTKKELIDAIRIFYNNIFSLLFKDIDSTIIVPDMPRLLLAFSNSPSLYKHLNKARKINKQ